MVSIIIVNYNTFQLTCNCIESIIKFTKDIAYEIIVVDNASIESRSREIKKIFEEKIVFIQSDKNLGFAGGNNLGIDVAKGDYILLLNSDVELFENTIGKTLQFLRSKNDVGAISCKLLNADKVTTQNAAQPFFSLKRHFLKTMGLSEIFATVFKKVNVKYDLNTNCKCDWIWGTFFLFPKKNLDIMRGRLTETFFMYSEDVEWCYLFFKNKLQNYYFSDSAIVHHIGKSNDPVKRKKNIRKSHLKFLRIYHGSMVALAEQLLLGIDDIKIVANRYSRKIKRKIAR